MELPAIITSDLHLTAGPDEEYRWSLFPWLQKQLEAEKAKTLLVLGDVTDAKDYHPSSLVNRVVRSFSLLRRSVPRVVVLKGNHDYLRDGNMFFEFLAELPGVEVVSKPFEDTLSPGHPAMFLPFTRSPSADWKGMDFSHYDYLFMHQTAPGSVASNGQRMDGEPLPELNAGKVYSGDIHVPQVVGAIEYVGSPYHVHFGDDFKPRCILIDGAGKQHDLRMRSPRRVMVDFDTEGALRDRLAGLLTGDHVKLRARLAPADRGAWRELRQRAVELCEGAGVQLCGLELRAAGGKARAEPGDRPAADFSPEAALLRFVEGESLGGEMLDAGLECME